MNRRRSLLRRIVESGRFDYDSIGYTGSGWIPLVQWPIGALMQMNDILHPPTDREIIRRSARARKNRRGWR